MLEPKVLSVQIFVLSSSRIQQRGYDTLFNYTTANPNSGVSKFVKQFPLKRQVRTAVAPSNVFPGCCIHACPYTAALFLLGAFITCIVDFRTVLCYHPCPPASVSLDCCT